MTSDRQHAVAGAQQAERPRGIEGFSGLDVVKAMRDGELPAPPLVLLFGFLPVEVENGRVVFSATPDHSHYNPLGTVHGGYVATLLDTAMGCAVHSTLAAGQSYTTLEFKVSFTRAMTAKTGAMRAEGKVLHRGRTVATAEARLTDASERLLAHATTTCLLFSGHEAKGPEQG